MTADLRHIQQGIYDGNETALAELYQLFHKKLIFFSKTITRSEEDAEEVVEDVFVKLWTNRHEVLNIDSLAVYLYVAVKNRSLNSVARKAREMTHSFHYDVDLEIEAITPDPYKLLITAEMMKQMKQAIDNLPPRCKIIFRLIREDGLQYKEVAEILNISVNTIDVQMAIAVKKICTAMEGLDFGNPVLRRSKPN